jgi:hypothetical protein
MILPLCEYRGYPIRVWNNDDTQGFFFFFQFCVVGGLAIIYYRSSANLATD